MAGEHRGAVRFFDVETSPPRNGRPAESKTLSFVEVIELINHEVNRRNKFAPTWADANEGE